MARRKPRRASTREWGSRFAPISHSTSTDTASVTSEAASIATISTTTTESEADSDRRGHTEVSRARFEYHSTNITPHLTAKPTPVPTERGDARSRAAKAAHTPPRPVNRAPTFPVPHSEGVLQHASSSSQPYSRRWEHSASVFVASLPPEPHAELDQLLRSHLGKHGRILNIKFINDIKAGNAATCAFVQFQVSTSVAVVAVYSFASFPFWDRISVGLLFFFVNRRAFSDAVDYVICSRLRKKPQT